MIGQSDYDFGLIKRARIKGYTMNITETCTSLKNQIGADNILIISIVENAKNGIKMQT